MARATVAWWSSGPAREARSPPPTWSPGCPRGSASSWSTPPRRRGAGTAYATPDDRHLLNVPASGMSAFPRDPEHFFRWVRQHHDPHAQPQDFVPAPRLRRLRREPAADGRRVPRQRPARPPPRPRRRHRPAGRPAGRSSRRRGRTIEARAVVLATGADPAPSGLPQGWPTPGPGRRPVGRRPARGRPAARRHRPDDGRRRDRRRPAGPRPAHRLPPRRRPRAATSCRPPRRSRRRRGSPACTRSTSCARPSRLMSIAPSPRRATGAPPSTGCAR